MNSVNEVVGIIGTWDDAQVSALQQLLSDRFVTVQQRRQVPERFGAQTDRGAPDAFLPRPWEVVFSCTVQPMWWRHG